MSLKKEDLFFYNIAKGKGITDTSEVTRCFPQITETVWCLGNKFETDKAKIDFGDGDDFEKRLGENFIYIDEKNIPNEVKKNLVLNYYRVFINSAKIRAVYAFKNKNYDKNKTDENKKNKIYEFYVIRKVLKPSKSKKVFLIPSKVEGEKLTTIDFDSLMNLRIPDKNDDVLNLGIEYKDVLKSVFGFYIKKTEKLDNDTGYSKIQKNMYNEFLKYKPSPDSSYIWEPVKCSYIVKDKKTNNKNKKNVIAQKPFYKIWEDICGIGVFDLKAKVNYDDSKLNCKSDSIKLKKKASNNEDVKTPNTQLQSGDEILNLHIICKNGGTGLGIKKILGIDNKIVEKEGIDDEGNKTKFSVREATNVGNADVKENLKESFVYTSLDNATADLYKNIGITKYEKGVYEFGNQKTITTADGLNEYNITTLSVYGINYINDDAFNKALKDYNKNHSEAIYKNDRILTCSLAMQDAINNGAVTVGGKTFNEYLKKEENFKKYLKEKVSVYADALDTNIRKLTEKIFKRDSYLGTEFEKAGVEKFLEAALLAMIIEDSNDIAYKIGVNALKIDKSNLDVEDIQESFKNYLINRFKINEDDETENLNYKTISKSNLNKMLLGKINEIKITEDNSDYGNEENITDITFDCVCKARRELTLYSVSDFLLTGDNDYRFATLLPSNKPLSEASSQDEYERLNIQQVEDFIQSWMVQFPSDKIETQSRVPIQGYYDMLSGMTPYVEIGFRDGYGSLQVKEEDGKTYVIITNTDSETNKQSETVYKKTGNAYKKIDKNGKEVGEKYSFADLKSLVVGSFTKIDNISMPYFKNLKIEDNGVKKITLTLFDPDFGSFTINPKTNAVFSLESSIRNALKNPFFEQDKEIDDSYYDNSIDYSEGITDDYLKLSEGFNIDPTNLKIRFGYADYNLDGRTGESIQKKIDEAFNSTNSRNARWWDESSIGANTQPISKIKKYIKNKEIQNEAGEPISIEEAGINSNVVIPENNYGKHISHNDMLKSLYQTTSKSREYNFMITGYNSEFTESGIVYTIQAIESKDAVTIKTRFLQRYSELTANPEEVLYDLMHIFNENYEGKNVESSPVKICLVEDEGDIMPNILNMAYDYKKIDEKNLQGYEAEDLYTMACYGNCVKYNPKYLKDITIKFGSEDAIRNYDPVRNKDKPPLYKNVAQLINEFCAYCPPKLKKDWKDIVGEDGNKIISGNGTYKSRPLKWFTFKDEVENCTYICLYYRKTRKLEKIRVYTWGPNNPTISCVRNLSIKNANEFAILSAVQAFKTGDGIIPRTSAMSSNITKDMDGNSLTPSTLKSKAYEIIGDGSKNYLNAYSSSLYNVNMTVLGDPSLCFDGMMQPYTYPIELDILVPQNEFTREALVRSGSKWNEAVRNKIKMNMPRFTKESYYNGTSWYGKDEKGEIKMEHFTSGNQALHEASGFYVISKIIHNITTSGYTTDLELVSYPNIENDVLLGYGKES